MSNLLTAAFSVEELRRLCRDEPRLQFVCHDFPEKASLNELVDVLLEKCAQQDRLDVLLATIEERNPRQYARYEDKIWDTAPAHRIAAAMPGSLLDGYDRAEVDQSRAEEAYLRNLVARFTAPGALDTTRYVELETKLRRKLIPFPQKRHIMLKGEPGSGKTLALRHLAVVEAKRALRSLRRSPSLPLYIRLEEYRGRTSTGRPDSVERFLGDYLYLDYPDEAFLHQDLKEYLHEGRLLLLLDGVNEMPAQDALARLELLIEFTHERFPRNRAIYACRTLHSKAEGRFTSVTIGDLDDGQIQRFLNAYLSPEQAEEDWEVLQTSDRFMLRLCRNPFMLHMFISRSRIQDQIPRNRAALFKEYVDQTLANVPRSSSICAMRTVEFLRELALLMNLAGLFAGCVTEYWIHEAMGDNWYRDDLEVATKARLIDRTAEGSVRFYHQILQEYFAASELITRLDQSDELDPLLRNPLWEETLILAAGLHEQPETFVQRLWDADRDSADQQNLVAKAMGSAGSEFGPEFHREVLDQLARNLRLENASEGDGELEPTPDEKGRVAPVVDTIRALRYIEDADTVALLAKVIETSDGWARSEAADKLASMREPGAYNALKAAIEAVRIPIVTWQLRRHVDGRDLPGVLLRSFPTEARFVGWGCVIWLALAFVMASFLGTLFGPGQIPDDVSEWTSYGSCLVVLFGMGILALARLAQRERERVPDASRGRIARAVFDSVSSYVASFVKALLLCTGIACVLAGLILAFDLFGFAIPLLAFEFYLLLVLWRARSAGKHIADLFLDPILFMIGFFGTLFAWMIPLFGLSIVLATGGLERGSWLSKLPFAVPLRLGSLSLAIGIQIALVMLFLFYVLTALIRTAQIRRAPKAGKRADPDTGIKWLVSIAESQAEWTILRVKAVRRLRALDVSAEYIDRLRSIDTSDRQLAVDLERTVYDLESLRREKERRAWFVGY